MDLNKDSASVQSGLGAKKVRLQALDNPQRVRQGGCVGGRVLYPPLHSTVSLSLQ